MLQLQSDENVQTEIEDPWEIRIQTEKEMSTDKNTDRERDVYRQEYRQRKRCLQMSLQRVTERGDPILSFSLFNYVRHFGIRDLSSFPHSNRSNCSLLANQTLTSPNVISDSLSTFQPSLCVFPWVYLTLPDSLPLSFCMPLCLCFCVRVCLWVSPSV